MKAYFTLFIIVLLLVPIFSEDYVAVVPFGVEEQYTQDEQAFREMIKVELDKRGLPVVTRDFSGVLNEAGFQRNSGLIDEDTIESIGYATGASYVVYGTFQYIWGSFNISCSLIDVDTGILCGSGNVGMEELTYNNASAAVTDLVTQMLINSATVESPLFTSIEEVEEDLEAEPQNETAQEQESNEEPQVVFAPALCIDPELYATIIDDGEGGASTAAISFDSIEHGGENFFLVNYIGEASSTIEWPFTGYNWHPVGNELAVFRSASGIRFNYVGDGNHYRVRIITTGVTDYDYHTFTFKALPGVNEISIRYRRFRQDGWGAPVRFVKNDIIGFEIMSALNDPEPQMELGIFNLGAF